MAVGTHVYSTSNPYASAAHIALHLSRGNRGEVGFGT